MFTLAEGEITHLHVGFNLAAMLKAAQAQSSGAPLAPLGRWGE